MLTIEKNHVVKDLVLSNSVLSCERTTSIFEATSEMAARNVGCIIIVENKKPVGIFTERDLLRKCISQKIDLNQTRIEEVMTPHPISITEDISLDRVLKSMRLGKFRHLVIVDQDGNLKNVVSVKDMVDWVVDEMNSK